ncbi:high affinity glucose transporter RGT2 [Dothidotthia symphoricarpi CBS 119687]|uniref:High affinity glucose transporter RGT2 n=1 Tax=Dothidotthia symphoricarpi CBS 119687 TaxID=1392245 RepID=A0A6A6AGF4_9PLEO|nr:high affinity glucose transporter RGT2 [Dothidotthia symphoricarpi CBS 119687]KAF2129994.1 high affinity glucose transporter RGT2 [Dothidotthia symphoricarpi CBS 119687]
MPGGGVVPVTGTSNVDRVEAPVTLRAYFIIAFAAFGGIFFGYDTGWMGGVLNMQYFIHMISGQEYPDVKYPGLSSSDPTIVAYRNEHFSISSGNQSLMTSILSAGTFFGAIISGDLADFIGRRFTIIIGCGIFTIGGIVETASTSVGVMTAGRIIAGFGVGFISAIVILYMSEIAPKKIRGAIVAGYQFCITIGILLANCVVYATQNRRDSGSYRIPIAIQFLWAIILATGLFILPESPRFWVKKGQLDKAAHALGRVRGQPLDSEYIQDELAEIIANHEYEMSILPQTSYIGSWLACFEGKLSSPSSNCRRTTIGIFMQMMQQLTGINFIFYFGAVFFQQLGSISDPFLISLVTTLVNVCCTPASFYLVERVGRRNLLIFGALGMVIMQFIVGIIGATAGKPSHHNGSATSAMIAFICLNIAVFATTWGPVAWIVIGEIFPLTIRSRGVGLSTASNWFWNCIIGVITPYLVADRSDSARLGSNVFFMWGGLCCVSFLFAYFFVPETKGLTLEQVDKMLEETTPRTSRGWKPHSTFASDMHLGEKHIEIPLENVSHKTQAV